MTAIYLVTFAMSAALISKWTLSHYDDDDDDDDNDDDDDDDDDDIYFRQRTEYLGHIQS